MHGSWAHVGRLSSCCAKVLLLSDSVSSPKSRRYFRSNPPRSLSSSHPTQSADQTPSATSVPCKSESFGAPPAMVAPALKQKTLSFREATKAPVSCFAAPDLQVRPLPSGLPQPPAAARMHADSSRVANNRARAPPTAPHRGASRAALAPAAPAARRPACTPARGGSDAAPCPGSPNRPPACASAGHPHIHSHAGGGGSPGNRAVHGAQHWQRQPNAHAAAADQGAARGEPRATHQLASPRERCRRRVAVCRPALFGQHPLVAAPRGISC